VPQRIRQGMKLRRGTGLGAALLVATACVLAAGPARAHADGERLSLAGSAQRGAPACQDPTAVCLPDGNYTIGLQNSNPSACRFDVRINWGDGSSASYVLGPSRDAAHHFAGPGVYTISVVGVGTPLAPETTCTGASGTIKVEVPVGADLLSAEVEDLLSRISGLARDSRNDLKRFLKTKHRKPSKKLERRVAKVVRDAREAKSLQGDYRDLDVPKEGDVVYPCPTSRPTRPARECAGEVAEKLEDLWGFLKSLRELADYPRYRRKRADQWYQTQEGRHTLDTLAWREGFAKGRTPEQGDYGRLTDAQKDVIASQAQVYDGAINKALQDAEKARRTGAEVVY
jgi:hypothetical protein